MFVERHAVLVLLAIAVTAPLLIHAAYRAVRSQENQVTDWLPKGYAETNELRWFRTQFAGDQFVVISWDGCRLDGNPRQSGAEPDDPRIEQLVRLLMPGIDRGAATAVTPSSAGRSPFGHPDRQFFKTVTTGRRVLNQLTSPPMSMPYAQAVQRLSESLIGPDGYQTCVVVTFAHNSSETCRKVLGRSVA